MDHQRTGPPADGSTPAFQMLSRDRALRRHTEEGTVEPREADVGQVLTLGLVILTVAVVEMPGNRRGRWPYRATATAAM